MVANGGIRTFQDVGRCLEYTGVQGVMSSEGILENPCLFTGVKPDLDEIALEYIAIAVKNKTLIKQVKSHVLKFLHGAIKLYPELIQQISGAQNMEELVKLVKIVVEKRKDIPSVKKYSWYLRHQHPGKIPNEVLKKQRVDLDKDQTDCIEDGAMNIFQQDEVDSDYSDVSI